MIHTPGCTARLHIARECTCPKGSGYPFVMPTSWREEMPEKKLGSCDVDTKGYAWEHAMIDIETMSTHPSNALILSCALVPFSPKHRDRLTIGAPLHCRFPLLPQLIAGRQVDASTQKFWAEQPKEAQARLEAGDLVGVAEFHALLKARLEGIKHLWARGIVFDIGNLATFFRQNGLVEPWAYNAPDDVRTITRHTAQSRDQDISEHGFVAEIIPHDPVSDCIKQAHEVWSHWSDPAPVAHHSV